MEFLQFLVQCMSTSLLFSLTLNWALQQISSWSSVTIYWSFNKTFHPPQKSYFLSSFWGKKKWQGKYFIFIGGWRKRDRKCILFQYCWRTCKNNLYWYSKGSIPNQEAATVQEMCVAVVQFYRHCMWRWANHKFK